MHCLANRWWQSLFFPNPGRGRWQDSILEVSGTLQESLDYQPLTDRERGSQCRLTVCSAQTWLTCGNCLEDVYFTRWRGEAVQMRPCPKGSFPKPSSRAPCLRDNAGPGVEVNPQCPGRTNARMRSRHLALAERLPRQHRSQAGPIRKAPSVLQQPEC